MARTSRLLVLAVAWAVPVCWTVLALLADHFTSPVFTAALELWVAARTDESLRAAVVPLEQRVGRQTHRMTVDLLGADESRADLEVARSQTLDTGEFYALLPPRDDIHFVRTVSDVPSVSIHLLANDTACVWRHRFEPATGAAANQQEGDGHDDDRADAPAGLAASAVEDAAEDGTCERTTGAAAPATTAPALIDQIAGFRVQVVELHVAPPIRRARVPGGSIARPVPQDPPRSVPGPRGRP